jgi:hypothetical protein
VCVLRIGENPGDDDWTNTGPQDRIEAVWELTLACFVCNVDGPETSEI